MLHRRLPARISAPTRLLPARPCCLRDRLRASPSRRVDGVAVASSNKGKGPEGETGPITGFLSPQEEERLLAFMTYVGLTGSLAVGGAWLAGVDLFGSLRWDADELRWALLLTTPIVLLDAVVLLPKYHAGNTTAEQHTSSTSSPGTASNSTSISARSSSSSSSSSQTSGAGSWASTSLKVKPLATDSSEGQLSKPVQNPAGLEQLRQDLHPGSGLFAAVRATSTLFQTVAVGMHSEGNLLSKPPQLALELVYVWLRDLTSELLQRGLILTFLAHWLQDRAFEAGVDDVAFFAPGQTPVYTTDLMAWVAGAVLTLAILPAVVGQAKSTSIAVASCAAVVAVQSGDEKKDEKTDKKLDQLMMEWRIIEAMTSQENAIPAKTAYAITLSRGILRNVLLNAVFVLKSNLAATLAMSVLTDTLLFIFCKVGRNRLPTLRKTQ